MNKIDVLLLGLAVSIHIVIYLIFPQSRIIYHSIPQMLNIFYIPMP
jgi:hypothetical protein